MSFYLKYIVRLTPRFHRVRLRRVTAAPRRSQQSLPLLSMGAILPDAPRYGQKCPRSVSVLGSAKNRRLVYFLREALHSAGQEVDRSEHPVNPQNKHILQTLSLRSLSSRRRNASVQALCKLYI